MGGETMELDVLIKEYPKDADRRGLIFLYAKKIGLDGGPGSGNFGHKGRPGKRGGSGKGGEESSSAGSSAPNVGYDPEAYKRTKTLSNYDEILAFRNEIIKEKISDLHAGYDWNETERKAVAEFEQSIPHFEKQLKSAAEKFDFSSRTDSKGIIGILESGRMKSQIETGTSKGELNPDLRRRMTSELFNDGESLDVPDDQREIYGYLDDAPGAEFYGNCRLVFKKDHLMGRTTLTMGDSLEQHLRGAYQLPTLASAPGFASYDIDTFDGGWSVKSKLEEIKRDFDRVEEKGYPTSRYVELQFHGGVTTDDIDYIEMPKSDPRAKEVEDLAKKKGVKVKWI